METLRPARVSSATLPTAVVGEDQANGGEKTRGLEAKQVRWAGDPIQNHREESTCANGGGRGPKTLLQGETSLQGERLGWEQTKAVGGGGTTIDGGKDS